LKLPNKKKNLQFPLSIRKYRLVLILAAIGSGFWTIFTYSLEVLGILKPVIPPPDYSVGILLIIFALMQLSVIWAIWPFLRLYNQNNANKHQDSRDRATEKPQPTPEVCAPRSRDKTTHSKDKK
jgi:hypothetical protein